LTGGILLFFNGGIQGMLGGVLKDLKRGGGD